MKRTPLQAHAARIRGLLTRFEAAVRAHELRGMQRAEDIPLIDQDYEVAKRKLLDAIGLLK